MRLVDERLRGGAAVHESRREWGLVSSLACLPLAPFQIAEAVPFLFVLGLLVVVGVVFERVPRVGIDQLAGGELVASAAQLWSLAVAARELGHACLLPCTVGRHQPADRLVVAPAWR